jgi:hypothetical protein
MTSLTLRPPPTGKQQLGYTLQTKLVSTKMRQDEFLPLTGNESSVPGPRHFTGLPG